MKDSTQKKSTSLFAKKRGSLTYMQFSKKVGLSHTTLHRMELGEQNVTLKTLEQITSRLNCSVADIFKD